MNCIDMAATVVWRFAALASVVFGLLAPAAPALAETGYDAWLRYAPISDRAARERYDTLPAVVVALGDSPIVAAAQDELTRGVRGMLGRTLRSANELPAEGAIILGTYDAVAGVLKSLGKLPELPPEGFWLKSITVDGKNHLVITAPTERGVLYGTFTLLRMIGLETPIADLNVRDKPYAPIRILNHWDNLDGTIERGYAGRSIFWENGHVTKDLGRVRDYARLMASVGINGCSINNVNADVRVISADLLPEVARVADVFRPYGVKLFISLDFASPRKIGGISTFDPLDPAAVDFWKRKVDEVYKAIPDLGGFVLKADSEGRLGPSEYGRTHADAANVIAQALEPHGGILFYRGFVYDHKMDWKNPKNDRARAAYDNFHPLDGKFLDNVVIQIKHGPIDFQVREPASPLFGGLPKTNQAIELQITQEYLGQQRHLCFLAPMWKEVLDFDLKANPEAKGDRNVTPVKDLVSGLTFKRPQGGFVGVSNVGRDTDWLGHQLAMANLYGFGRLAWNPNLESREIAEEWTRLTFGPDPKVVGTIVDMLLKSWNIYENYTGPNGVGTLTDIITVHYGPGIESSENNGWGQWHRADDKGIGMDRTVATGTGYIGQYSPAVARVYESLETCPDELLLFMQHVPYNHKLHSGKTLIQHIYDAHYDGARDADRLVRNWTTLKGRVDEARYQEVLDDLNYQAGHAQVWRDAISNWFLRKSGIADDKKRVGNYPNRVEAEAMQLDGYEAKDVTPWETASGGQAAALTAKDHRGTISYKFTGKPGWYDLEVAYFDENDGLSKFKLYVGDQLIDEWTADDTLPHDQPSGHTSTRHKTPSVALRPDDVIRLEGTSERG
ncbi:MAG: alpha-glucuronidase family glycosyl hydrolase, partial [Pirellulales bacterium]